MIIKIIFNKINIHFFYYIVAIIAVLTGLFKEFIIFTSIIIIHELGHVITALYYKWYIDKIVILPFGGLTIFKETLNKPIKEELFILIMGPIAQIIFYFLYNIIFGSNLLLTNYHYALLFFNLLPIYPLDGSKLINLFFNKIFSFKFSHLLTIYISALAFIILFILIIINKFNLLFMLILFFMVFKIIDEYNKHDYIFNKFLFERLLYDFYLPKRKIIKGNKLNKMCRDYRHLFFINKKYCLEKEILQKKFDFR